MSSNNQTSIRQLKKIFFSWVIIFSISACGIFVPSDDYGTNTGSATSSANKPSGTTTSLRNQVVADATELLGVKYHYGGVDPRRGMDCSGMLNYVFQNVGIMLRRSSREQVKDGVQIRKKEVKPGDLVFFARGGTVFHVALVAAYDGGNKMEVIHSTSSKGVIRQEILNNSYWAPKIHSYRNVISW